jgi:hypothetical protein
MTTLSDIKDIDQRAQVSAGLIKNHDLKNRKKFPFIPTRIVDNFFEAPTGWRAFALDQSYERSDTGTWPGVRSKSLDQLDSDMFEIFAKKLLQVLPEFVGFRELGINFHLIDETFDKGWVHDDDPTLNVVGVVYLNKNAPPDSGTTLYCDQYDLDADRYRSLFKQDVLSIDPEERKKLTYARDDQRSKYRPSMVVENVFNRCVIYDPRTWHSPNKFFGKTKEDSRLNIVFFAQGVRK